jgi:peptide alpha-N-acetyltransferase
VNGVKDLDAKVSEVLKSSFTIAPADADLKSYNEQWLQKHSESPAHLQSAYSVRYILDNSTKSQNEADLKKVLELPSTTLEQATAGLTYLDSWNSDEKTKDAYREAAAKKWPQAIAFQK